MHLSIGQGLKLFVQAGYFVLIARSLGPDAFGAFAAVVALAAVLGPFSGMGTPNLFIRDVRSGKREAAICWGNGLLLTILSGTTLTIVVVALNYIFHLKTGIFVVVIVCLSDLIFMKVPRGDRPTDRDLAQSLFIAMGLGLLVHGYVGHDLCGLQGRKIVGTP